MDGHEFMAKAEGIKGRIIARMSAIDLLVAQIIAWHVNREKTDIVMFLCNKVNLRHKLVVLERIIKVTPDAAQFTYPKLLDDIEKLQALRNKFAHSMPLIDNKTNYKNATHIDLLNSNKLGKNKDKYMLSEFEKDMFKFDKVTAALYNAVQLID